MAISTGSKLLQSDITSIYNSFNTFIQKYGGTITQLSVPSGTVKASDINNLNAKINEFKRDTYLSTQSSWWVNASVTTGNIIYASNMNGINTTVANFAKVKCRNNAGNSNSNNNNSTNNYGARDTCSNGSNSNGSKSNGSRDTDSNGTCRARGCGTSCANGRNSNTCYDGKYGDGTCNQGSYSNSTHGNGNCTANGNCTRNGTHIDITNSKS